MESTELVKMIDERLVSMPLELKAKLNAISHLRVKFRILESNITVDEEFEKLADYWALQGAGEDLEKPLLAHREAYMEQIQADLFKSNADYFDFADSDSDKLAVFAAYILKMYIYSSSDDKEYRDACIKAYYPLLSSYTKFIAKYIVESNRYDLTSANKDNLIKYVDLQNSVDELVSTFTNGKALKTTEELVNNVMPELIQLIKNGLSTSYTDNLTSIIAISFVTYAQAMLGGPCALVELPGLNDTSTLQTMIGLSQKVKEAGILNETQNKYMQLAVSKIEEKIKEKQASNSGCMILYILITTLSASVIWGVSNINSII